ncbi:TetR/AcrR family transcriptional regulator [Halobacillus massiliensis]|uniref:TetR/AcrR family transcriptional regulator n=1 Tax=Halobacillus massiliensis TaxID=1926286 RepID=UPI0009E435D0|nr:TetR/AcrR family transcriptional regulator [Halobacillus massiliensis]
MTGKFESLEDEKRERILRAAFLEFAEKGYDQASTNAIVKNAGIGKGMLFYYFKNKKALYYYLMKYSLNVITEEYFQRIDITESDFIERFKQASQVKMETYLENPELFRFTGTFLVQQEENLSEDLKKRLNDVQKQGFSIIYDNIDYSLFRKDIDVEKAFNLIRWSIDGYQNEIKERLKGQNLAEINFDPLWEEFYEYLEVLKKTFYS